MHFLIFLALIGCFVIFPNFRKAIASLLVVIAIGFTVISGPMLLVGGVPKGQGNFWFWTFFVVIGFIVFYAFVYSDKLNTNPPNIVDELAVQTEIEASSWNQAIDEFEGETRNRGLYAKLFAENHGDESKVKARYIEIRAEEFQAIKTPVVTATIETSGNFIDASNSQELISNSTDNKNKENKQRWKEIFLWVGTAYFVIFVVRKVFF